MPRPRRRCAGPKDRLLYSGGWDVGLRLPAALGVGGRRARRRRRSGRHVARLLDGTLEQPVRALALDEGPAAFDRSVHGRTGGAKLVLRTVGA